MNNPIRIFLSYARADESLVKELYRRLKDWGFAPWMDTEDLLPGERFEYAIRQAIRSSDFFLACLTCNSANRRGVIQKEICEALEVLQEKLEEDIFLIPVRLEACDVPEALRAFHWADLHDAAGFDKLLRALQREIEKQQRELPAAHEGQVKSLSADNSSQAWTEPHTGMEFVWIPPGRFMMGQTDADKKYLLKSIGKEQYEKYYLDELPRHEVQIPAGFWMGKYPVTQAQWKAVMENNPSHFKGDNLPVEQVSWEDCQKFIQAFMKKSQGTFRLPTEAEWEYSCRAGTTTPFYCGDAISTDQANYDGNYTYGTGKKGVYRQQTTAVGSFPPNAWGLYDMHGNVWEWCEDIFDSDAYTKHSHQNPLISSGGSYRVLRGGSWSYVPRYARSANRFSRGAPSGRYGDVGLRLVRKK